MTIQSKWENDSFNLTEYYFNNGTPTSRPVINAPKRSNMPDAPLLPNGIKLSENRKTDCQSVFGAG